MRRNSKRGGVGLIILLLALGIAGYLVYLQLKGKSLPQARDLGGLPGGMVDPKVLEDVETKPSQTIEHFKNQVDQMNQQQQERLDQMQKDLSK